MCKQLISFINSNLDVVITPEDSMGKLAHVIDHIKENLISYGFQQEVICEYDLTEKYLEKKKK